MNDKKYAIYLHSIWFSQRKLRSIFEKKQNYKEVFDSLDYKNLQRLGFSESQIPKILEAKKSLQTEKIDIQLAEHQVSIIIFWESNYPKLLQEISLPPYIIYVQWQIPQSPCLAVIGSRKISSYGEKVTTKLVGELSTYFTIVSGWAYGCDSAAHESTLASGGKTIVVIGTGIDVVYPAVNKKLYQRVLEKWWCILSVFQLGEPGNPYNFPIRNEIISGLSLGTLVVEAGEKSGTLITANLALEQGRDVFVIPGEIDKNNSIGCNNLLKQGAAKLVTSSSDILEEYDFLLKQEKNLSHNIQDPLHKKICDILSYETSRADALCEKTNVPISQLSGILSLLEMKKILRKNQEWKYELY